MTLHNRVTPISSAILHSYKKRTLDQKPSQLVCFRVVSSIATCIVSERLYRGCYSGVGIELQYTTLPSLVRP